MCVDVRVRVRVCVVCMAVVVLLRYCFIEYYCIILPVLH